MPPESTRFYKHKTSWTCDRGSQNLHSDETLLKGLSKLTYMNIDVDWAQSSFTD